MMPRVSQEAMHSSTFATLGRAVHEHLVGTEQENEDADDHNMTSARLSKILLPEGVLAGLLGSEEITSLLQDHFYDKATSSVTQALATTLEKHN